MYNINFNIPIDQIQNRRCFTQVEDMVVFFGRGKVDDWCTYIGHPEWDKQKGAYVTMCGIVTDAFYFSICKQLYDRYGDVVWYDHLSGLYNMVQDHIDSNLVALLQSVTHRAFHQSFPQDAMDAYFAYVLIYYGMVAEENYNKNQNPNTCPVCGKLIKMAGLYKHLVLNVPLGTQSNPGACHCYVGMNPNDILQDAAQYGIFRNAVVHYLM